MNWSFIVSAAVLAAAAASCGGGGGSDDDDSPGSGGSGGSKTGGASGSGAGGSTSTSGDLRGFTVELKPYETGGGMVSLGGNVYSSAYPPSEDWESKGKSGGCELLVPKVPFCDPVCGGSAVCRPGNSCVPYPAPANVGDVTVHGVGSGTFTMKASGSSLFYAPPMDVQVPYPPAADGAEIRMEATGGAFGAFSLKSEAIAPLAVTSSNPAAIQTGSPLRITWTAGQSDLARIHVELDLSHHGGTKGAIRCDVADTGSLDIPAAMLSDLIGLGVAGFPTVSIARVARGTATVAAGTVFLDVKSQTKLDVTVPGLVSCNSREDCPTGQTCGDDLQCK